MPLSWRDPANLWDMLQAAERVQDFLKNKNFDDFLTDDLLRAAVERNLGIIGEAARRISEEFKQEHPGNSLAPDHSPAQCLDPRI